MTERIRPPRRPLVPVWVAPFAIALLVLVLAVVGYGMWSSAEKAIAVPDVVGVDSGVATARLAQSGLTGAVVERRFGPAEEGIVLEQDPAPGTQVTEGATVSLVVSAGSEEFEMPDVVGLSLRVAQAQLEQSGLTVKVDQVASEQPEGMVLATNPAPGATVRTADIVRVTVAAKDESSTATLPYRLDGLSVVLDPSTIGSDTVDAPMEVARRLQSLLQASGATVTVTRSATATDTTEAGRAQRAAEASAAVVIGLDVASKGQGGLSVTTLAAAASADSFGASTALAEELATQLSSDGIPVGRTIAPSDTVLQRASTVGARVRLGSAGDPEDIAAFRDPTWSDSMARAIYRAIGVRFGSR